MSWNSGYVTDIEYTHGYYPELNPARQAMAFHACGLATREPKFACELGFGQGLSVAIHSAASRVEWWGTDFNPAQAGFARQLVEGAGSGAKLFDEPFAEFCARSDLPSFDFIGLHGIWSWISDRNKEVLVDLIRRRLNPGGVLYISYNTLPGWAPFAPVQHLMKLHSDLMGAPGQNFVQRVLGAIAFAEQVLGTDPLYIRASPKISDRLDAMKHEDRRYLGHEYFNANWTPMHVADLASRLQPTRCEYACSASFLEHIDSINLKPDQQELLRQITHPIFRESVRDFLVNRWFRQDYWAKGVRRLSRTERSEKLRDQKVVLITDRAEVPVTIAGARYKVPEAVYGPVLDQLSDNRPRSFAQLEHGLRTKGIKFDQIFQSIAVLAGAGFLESAQSETRAEESTDGINRLNTILIDKARGDSAVQFLASPVTGGGVPVSRLEQLFLLARRNGLGAPECRAAFVWSILQEQGDPLVKEGKVIENPEDNLAELTTQARRFDQKREPILNALGIS